MHATTEIPTINRRPGKLWAFLQFPLSRLVLALLFVTVPVTLLQLAGKAAGLVVRSPLGIVMNLILVAVTIGGYALYVRWIERRPAIELDKRGAVRQVLTGFLIGATLFCATMLLLWLMGAWTYTGPVPGAMWIYPLATALLVSTIEETLLRGVLFRLLEEHLGSWIALALSATVFGLMHAFNPGASATSVVAIALEAGVLLAAAFMFSRRLWFVFGLHAAWNFTEGGIFATHVSGAKVEGVIGVQFGGSEWLTGGAFGPEASVVAVGVCLLAAAGFIAKARRKGLILPPVWFIGASGSASAGQSAPLRQYR